MISCQAKATIESIGALSDFAEDCMNESAIGDGTKNKCLIIIDEVVNNISSYAYPDGNGTLLFRIGIQKEANQIIMVFEDSGIPFNPITQESPDLDGDADERPVGGLGIFMVRKLSEDVQYSFENGRNILTVTIQIG